MAKIPGKKSIPGYNTEVEIDEVADQYEAYSKDIGDVPKNFDDDPALPITWFNNFGVKKSKSNIREDKVPKYRVILQELPAGKRLCIYLPANKQLLEITPESGTGQIKYKNIGNGKIAFYLENGDPPSGLFP